MRKEVRFLAGLVLAVALVGCEKAGFVIRPYLQSPGKTEMTIMWTVSRPCAVEVRYGVGEALDQRARTYSFRLVEYRATPPDPEDPVEAPLTSDYVYEARLFGLLPGTDYRYRVTADGRKADGTFRTSPDAPEPFSFVAYGDSRTDFRVHRRVAASIGAANPAFILHTGDLVSRGYYREYRPEFFGPLSAVIDHIPIWTGLGNHEGGGKAYLRLFSLPGNERWYSFDYANAHFIGLDSNAGRSSRPQMLAWLEQDLAASQADWKIVYYHHPSYDVGSHQTRWGHLDFLPLFRKHKVDLVLTGHSHTYQRFHPMFTPGENEKHPITHVVTAGGGAGLHSLGNSPYVAALARKYHYLLVTIDGLTLSGRALTPAGEQIDAFEISKEQGRFDAAYLARAMPEADFDTFRDLIFPSLRGIAVPTLPQVGHPVSVSLSVGAGEFPMKFRLRLVRGGHYVMKPTEVTGESPAKGTTDVTVTIRAKGTTYLRGTALNPRARFICDYEINGQKGSVLGGALRYTPPEAAPANGS